MKVRYPGHMKGHHVIGRRSASLSPGVNEVTDELGQALIDQEICLQVPEAMPIDDEDIDEVGRDEGTE